MASQRPTGDEKDNRRVFRWGIAIAVLLLLLVVIYNLVALKRDGPLPKAATPPAAVQQQKP